MGQDGQPRRQTDTAHERVPEQGPAATAHEQGLHISKFFSTFSTWLAKWTGSHWAVFVGGFLVVVSLAIFGMDRTNIAISIVTLLMLLILQNTQNRDSAALHLKLDDLITGLHGPHDHLAGVESKTSEELEELRKPSE